MTKLLIAAGFVLAASSAALAQDYRYAAPPYAYAPPAPVYDYAPGYGYGGYAYAPRGDWFASDRVNSFGRGNSAESQR